MTGDADQLSSEWRRDYDVWRPGINQFFEEQQSTDVKILSWGPSPHSEKHYQKRQVICQDLATNPRNLVFTSEQLFEEDSRFKEMEVLTAEEIQADEADIIICLQVDDPGATGAPTEIVRFGNHPRIGGRIRLILPREPQSSRLGLLYLPSQQFPGHLTFKYSKQQYVVCEDIRAKCREWVEAVRREKHLTHWQNRDQTK